MRDRRYITEHCGGPLKNEQHRQLIHWACKCTEHVLPFFGENTDERLKKALFAANEWEKGNVSAGDARDASLEAISVTKELSNPTATAIARSIGHAVATAHMADHALVAAMYALKAVKNAGQSIDVERKWQNEQLPSEITELILTARSKKEKVLKI